jgi:FGGY-family pentulose kinase
MSCFMGIDIGTQSVRCCVVDEQGCFLSVREEKYPTVYPRPGYAEQSPKDWIRCLEKTVLGCREQVGDRFKTVSGIAVCSTSSTVVPVNKNGEPLSNAILWMDNRAVEQAEKINKTGHEVLKHCGGEVSVEWLVPKMMWIRDNQPDIFAEAEHIVEVQDYINHYLTGNWAASVCQATCKSNYVEEKGGFSSDFFEKIGFPEFFDKAIATVLNEAEPVGKIAKETAEKLGLPENAVVYQGGVDAHVNMIGLGVCRSGETGVVMGSSFVQLALTDKPFFGDGIWGPYKNAVVPGKYCLEGGQVSAGSIVKWFIHEFNITSENPFKFLGAEAADIPKGSDGLLLLDFFQGNRTPYKDPNAKGVYYGLTLAHTRAHMYRAILEGVAFGMRNILDSMEKGAETIKQLRGCGGVTHNELWLRIISDVTGKPIVLTENSGNAGILGSAIIAAVGAGYYTSFEEACDAMTKVTTVVNPDLAGYKEYSVFYERYLALYQSTKKLNV